MRESVRGILTPVLSQLPTRRDCGPRAGVRESLANHETGLTLLQAPPADPKAVGFTNGLTFNSDLDAELVASACIRVIRGLKSLPWANMKIPEQGKLLRIFIGESDRWHHQPLYEALVLKARELGLAGATVLRGPMGFGAHSRLHTAKILRLSMDLPMVIEIVDTEEKINLLLPHVEEMVQEGLVTLEDVKVLKYRANATKPEG